MYPRLTVMGILAVEIGSRIHCEGEFGTVLYHGPIENIEGTWLGVEWDNSERGKHSGSYKGVTYFHIRVQNAGSFIKISKADLGISCPEAVKIKYGKESGSENQPNFVNLPQKSGATRHIEIVGMKKIMGKQSKFSQLTEIVLSSMLISHPGQLGELEELIPNVRNLDLSQNLLSSWESVNLIVKQLPSLSTLILSKNRLKCLEDCSNCQDIYSSLKMLVLNNMGYCWKEILETSVMWPSIEHLCVLDNRITQLERPLDPVFSELKTLVLDNNNIALWSEICKLGYLIKLEELHVDNTSLESVSFPEVPMTAKTTLFPSLKTLFIRKNNLNKWQDFSELNKLPTLKNLMINYNPILATENVETARQLIIAKMPDLQNLNRSTIERSERRGAEFDYLKKYHKEWTNSRATSPENFAHEHPTYALLLSKHGAPEDSEVKIQSALIKDNLICVKIFSPMCPEKAIVSRRLPAEMTVGKLKALVQRIFKVAAHEITLTRLLKEDESQKTEMDNDLRQLSFYSVSNEDKISVEW